MERNRKLREEINFDYFGYVSEGDHEVEVLKLLVIVRMCFVETTKLV